ncbi:Unknown protein sequence [Pseudomonas coronafaciens pv. oryzae]|nr:Unknown protein sequence [Pseudomonas coronafaciens pv. oryzae]
MGWLVAIDTDHVNAGFGELVDSGCPHGTQAKHGYLAALFHLSSTSKKSSISGGWVF